MRIPVPENTLVAFTLAGALLTAIVAGALAAPIGGLTQPSGPADPAGPAASDPSPQVASDGPTPNPNFSPAVQTRSGYDGEHEAYEEEHEERDEAEHESAPADSEEREEADEADQEEDD
ncbi:MAG: hypothetical protein ABEJ92_01555 [Halobacteriales archaeon]